MNRNDVGKNFINVNLCIKTENDFGRWSHTTAGAEQLICGEDKSRKHRCIYLSIDGHGFSPKHISKPRANTHKRIQTPATLSVVEYVAGAFFGVHDLLKQKKYAMLFSLCAFPSRKLSLPPNEVTIKYV